MNQECQYSAIFENLTVIGLSAQDLYAVSLYMNEERGLAEDFCKLYWVFEHVRVKQTILFYANLLLYTHNRITSIYVTVGYIRGFSP